jgi:uncharacterized protein
MSPSTPTATPRTAAGAEPSATILAPAPAPPPVRPIDSAPSGASASAHSDAIALILPLESAVYGRAADAVKAGFLAAAEQAGSRDRVRVIGHGDDGVLLAVNAAQNANVALIVGPLTRDDLKAVIALAPVRPRMLALNQSDDGAPLPNDAYALTLAIDADAALLARVARADGVRTVSLVASAGSLQQRFASAFTAEWQRAGGSMPRQYRFDANPDMLALLRRELGTRPTDAVVLAVDSEQAALAKSFMPPGPVYAVSQIADDLTTPISHDLDGVRYVEIPWLADPDSPALASLPRSNFGNAVIERLYALGLDAFAIAQMLAEPLPPQRIELEGATGHLSLTPARSFARQGRLMEIRDGRAQPVPTVP